jgi:hypothetical protein
MACYISSNENRFYAGLETKYGTVANVAAANRFPAVSLTARQTPDRAQRRDKTGSRTYIGAAGIPRKKTDYEIKTYMTGWDGGTSPPPYGPLFQAALGSAPIIGQGGTVSSANGTHLQYSAAHGLAIGQAVRFGGELRFVSAIADAQSIILNAPFTLPPAGGAAMGPTMTYQPATDLPSVSIFDYWGPALAVQRVIAGAAVNKLRISVNADYHEFAFSGGAQDILDNASFSAGQGALTEFPPEPLLSDFDYSIIPGHLGQVWLGISPNQFFTLTSAEIELNNGIDLRVREFGANGPRCIAAGQRSVTMNFSLYEMEDAATQELYQAARQRSPISVMFQLGQQAGQLAGVYMKSVVPELPEFDDREVRLQWKFTGSRAQGTVDDELYVAFA